MIDSAEMAGSSSARTRTLPKPRAARPRLLWLASALLGAAMVCGGCGDDGDDAERTLELRAYRTALEPVIVEVSAIEAEVAERAVGSSGVATAANLDAVYREVRPRLLEALVTLDRLESPAQLTDVHEAVRRLIVLRLDAYGLVMQGYAAGDDSVYAEAEEKLRQANALIPDINARLCDVDVALGDRDNCRILG